MSTHQILSFLALLFSGLIAGLLFSYSYSVNPGLKTLSNSEYVKAMQAINIAIQNPGFLISFMGLLIIFPALSYLSYQHARDISFYLILVASIIYIIGVFGVTIFFNVPLNEILAKIPLSDITSNELQTIRDAFEKPWNYFHSIRTIASILSFCLLIIAMIKIKY